jgi:asparaginyl-tRNA synthetase
MTKHYLDRTSISQLLAGQLEANSTVIVRGWVRTRRDSKAGLSFIALHDGSCFESIQVVANNSLSNYEEEILKLSAGCSIVVKGQLVDSPAKGQKFEIHAEKIEVLGWVEDPETYPISPKHHTLEYLREYAHLRVRTNTFSGVARVRNCISQAIHRFFYENGFYWVHAPIVTGNDCEGAGEMFRVSTLDLMNLPRLDDGKIDFSHDFYGKETFLTVSGQLNVEAYCEALTKVYTFGPTFRAENSNTTRHLSEFWMIEPEIAFADLKDDIDVAVSLLKYVCKAVLDERMDDMQFFAERYQKDAIVRLENMVKTNFEIITYTDAVEALQKAKKKFDYPVVWGVDLQTEHERYLTEELLNKPVVVMNYPKAIKAFYMRANDDHKTVAAMDVLAPGIGEIIGGSQREERLDVLDHRMDEMKLDKNAYWWYRDLRKYGTVPHAGFGLGLDRFVCYVTGMQNIRDAIPYPRAPKHAEF